MRLFSSTFHERQSSSRSTELQSRPQRINFPLWMSWGKGHLNSNARNTPKSIQVINISQICFNFCNAYRWTSMNSNSLNGRTLQAKIHKSVISSVPLTVTTKAHQSKIQERNQCNLQFLQLWLKWHRQAKSNSATTADKLDMCLTMLALNYAWPSVSTALNWITASQTCYFLFVTFDLWHNHQGVMNYADIDFNCTNVIAND